MGASMHKRRRGVWRKLKKYYAPDNTPQIAPEII